MQFSPFPYKEPVNNIGDLPIRILLGSTRLVRIILAGSRRDGTFGRAPAVMCAGEARSILSFETCFTEYFDAPDTLSIVYYDL